MARIRSLKPDAFQSETLANVSLEAERTFLGLSTQADDRGRFRWQPKTLNGMLWSERGNHSAGEFEQEMKELQSECALCQYVGCDGKLYGHLINWDSHQRIDKPSPSRIPPCKAHPSVADEAKNRCIFHDQDCPGSPQVSPTLESSGNPPGVLSTDLGSRILDLGPRTVDLEKDQPAKAAPRDDVEKLIEHLHDRIEANTQKRPRTSKQTRTAARLLLDADKVDPEEAHRLVDWSQQHQFWHSVVLSMPKFREKYPQMLLQAKSRGQPGKSGYQAYQNPPDQSEYDRPLEAS